MIPTSTTKLFEQLDYRENDGIEVSLLWTRRSGSLTVYVCDTRNNDSFEVTVAPERARDACEHPFAYAAR